MFLKVWSFVVFSHCSNNCSDFKTPQIYYLTVLEIRSLNGSHWAKIKVSAGLRSLLEALGENSFSCLFQLLKAACIPWPMVPFHLQPSTGCSSLSHSASVCHSLLLPSTYKDPGDYIQPTEIVQVISPSQGRLISNLICNFYLPWFLGIRAWMALGAVTLLPRPWTSSIFIT